MVSFLTGLIGLSVTATILLLIRNDKLHAANGLGWVIVAGVFATLGLAPKAFDELARFLGVNYSPALALTLCVTMIIIKLLLHDIHYSRLRVRHQRLVQRMALIETELRRVRQQFDIDADQ
jgi:hypothetical protein